MEICSKQAGVIIISSNPNFKYKFKKANESIDVKKEHVEKILRNPTFYEAGKESVELIDVTKEFEDELIEINGIGKKTANDIIEVFKTREDLIKAIDDDEDLPFDSDVDVLLKEAFG